ncbi:hypothetical protein GCM10023189_45860 [Nibrella saemangeumensis]|uniref:FAD-binding PCMH-type domain-containing protein n=1 Tax=Nibrella saemangeumensis TaxID=1084526 RepID=A0ABP8NH02_9BACT
MIRTSYTYAAPDTLEEALSLVGQDGQQVLTGDQSLIGQLKQGIAQPQTLVSLRKIPGMANIDATAGDVQLGALVTYADLSRHSALAGIPALAEAVNTIQDPHLRNHSTIGGALYQGGPIHGPVLAVLAALDAEAVLATQAGEKRVAITELLQNGSSGLLTSGQLLKGVVVPLNQDVTCTYLPLEQLPGQHARKGIAVGFRRTAEGQADQTRLVVAGFTPFPARFDGVDGSVSQLQLEQTMATWLTTVPAGFQRHLIKVLINRALSTIGVS